MTWKVTAALVLATDERGQTHHAYRGTVLDWLSPAQAEFFLAEGLVEVVGEEKPSPATRPADSGDDADRPPAAATKAELIAWLVDNAVKPDGGEYTAGGLQPMNKDELRDLIDAVED